MEQIDDIAKKLREGYYTSNPVGASEDLAILAGNYAWVCGMLEQILQRKPALWNTIRRDDEVKSDTQAERIYQKTEDGINEMGLRLRLKAMDKMSSALKSLIRIAEGESNNQL